MTSAPEQAERPDLWPGHHQSLGATYDGGGTNFAVWSPEATAVYLCLFEGDAETRVPLPQHTLGVWHGYLPGAAPGLRYGFRAEGPWNPRSGHLFNADKLLLDPYARAIDGAFIPHQVVPAAAPDGSPNPGDSASYVPRSVVVANDDFDWGDDAPPNTPWRQVVVYEAHVRGLTMLQPQLPAELRGTFAALGHESTTAYLTTLGVTAVELLPCQHHLSEPYLIDRGLVNYWGYNTVGFFAPHAGYAATGTGGEQVTEFKQMVKNLHAAGLEVILDVVYNHTCEGGPTGPSVCFRGLGDGSYYLYNGDGGYLDVTGCGNTVDVSAPQALTLVMDSLRYWVTQMHVDGFRFDLAPALCRNNGRIDLNAPFLTAIHQDPVLREVKLIAEPWDATSEGYLVGRFPSPWCEWNDKFRDTVRDFWRGQSGGVRDLASRLSGSSDLYADDGRLPFSSINFATAHDGFTLRDLVSYDGKHNEANGDDNNDGTDDNRSWNCGVEGETGDEDVLLLRHRQAANIMATLLLATGVPMLVAGDESGRTQGGNNNAYCQDNETSWLSWAPDPAWQHLSELTAKLLRLRATHPVLHQRYFFEGRPYNGSGRKDITWLQPSGDEMTGEAWMDSSRATLGVFLAGDALRGVDDQGEPVSDTSFVLWLHAGSQPVEVTLPKGWADHYIEVVRTDDHTADAPLPPGSVVSLLDHTFALYEAVGVR
ncbi:MAG TPA: glycogen debranching protein GlgX [Nocardioidaceae bacterium]|nr:glycogen debranching protein GlgX [Nocardioidaceae bacterium]